MDTKFQTSFIPKKAVGVESPIHAHNPSSSTRFFSLFAIIVFIASIAGAILSYLDTNLLTRTQGQYQATLKTDESEFNPPLIQTLQRVNTKIGFAKTLLASHLAPDAILGIIGQLTAENISFNTLSYAAPTNSNNEITLNMTGTGASFSAIAFQSDVFGSSVQYGENITLKNPVLSGLTLNQNGSVGFSFTTELDPSNILYSKILAQSLGGTSAAVPASAPSTSSSTQGSQ